MKTKFADYPPLTCFEINMLKADWLLVGDMLWEHKHSGHVFPVTLADHRAMWSHVENWTTPPPF